VTLAGLASANVLIAVLWGVGSIPLGILAAWLLVQQGLLLPWRRRLKAPLRHLDVVVADLSRVKEVLARIEAQPFRSARLGALREGLLAGHLAPSRHIARLERLVGILDSCRNQMFAPVAMLLLVRSQIAIAISRWHAQHGRAVDGWLRSVGELEALSALATYAFEHPADPFPVLVDDEVVFDAAGLAHPLLPLPVAVRNDLRIGGAAPHVLVVSGSNMSGKSTLLRAVGMNIVLALAGAPVRASSLRVSRLAIGATLRIEDSLQEGLSKFYAEILRIRAILDRARGPVPVAFLLDEILGGTNSHDRRIGAEAIVKGLAGTKAIGLVTTHDLALTELVDGLGVAAANVHFEDRFEDGRLVFDYRMRPGVITRGNALALMRAVGLIDAGI
jgi:DNA mismatch repair ATPase MutS